MTKAIVFISLMVAVFITGCDSDKRDRFNTACAEQGGFVANTSNSWFASRIDCIKDNHVVYLPGFA